MSLLKLQRGALSVVVGVITGHYIMGTHTRRIVLGYLANDFCRSCRDEKVEGTVLYLSKLKELLGFLLREQSGGTIKD